MNIDISYWRKNGRKLYEYPGSYMPLKTYGMLGKDPFKGAWATHLSVERSGDLMCYIFYRMQTAGTYVGLNIYVNGYAYTSLGELEALITPMLGELANQSEAATGIIEAKRAELRTELANTVRYRVKPLAPLDYSIGDNYLQHFNWEADKETVYKIVRSTEMGMTHISFSHYSHPQNVFDPEPPIKLNLDTDLEEKEENTLPQNVSDPEPPIKLDTVTKLEEKEENAPIKKKGKSEGWIVVLWVIFFFIPIIIGIISALGQ